MFLIRYCRPDSFLDSFKLIRLKVKNQNDFIALITPLSTSQNPEILLLQGPDYFFCKPPYLPPQHIGKFLLRIAHANNNKPFLLNKLFHFPGFKNLSFLGKEKINGRFPQKCSCSSNDP